MNLNVFADLLWIWCARWERPSVLKTIRMYPNPSSARSIFCSERLDLNFDRLAMSSSSRTTQSASDFSAWSFSRLALASSMTRFASWSSASLMICKIRYIYLISAIDRNKMLLHTMEPIASAISYKSERPAPLESTFRQVWGRRCWAQHREHRRRALFEVDGMLWWILRLTGEVDICALIQYGKSNCGNCRANGWDMSQSFVRLGYNSYTHSTHVSPVSILWQRWIQNPHHCCPSYESAPFWLQ